MGQVFIAIGGFFMVMNPWVGDSPAKSNTSLRVHFEGAAIGNIWHLFHDSRIQHLCERLKFLVHWYARLNRGRWVGFILSFSWHLPPVLRKKVFARVFFRQSTSLTSGDIFIHALEVPPSRTTYWYIHLAPCFHWTKFDL